MFCIFINYIMFTNISLCEGEFFPSKTGSSIVHCVLDPDQQKRSGSSITGENIYISRQDTIYYYILLINSNLSSFPRSRPLPCHSYPFIN